MLIRKNHFPKPSNYRINAYDVARAIDEDRIEIAVQAVHSSEDFEVILFEEILIRMIDENGDVRAAGDFIREAIRSNIGSELDVAALRNAIRYLKIDPTYRVSINLTMKTIGHNEWSKILQEAYVEDPEITARIIIELSELEALENIELVQEFMSNCRNFGVIFAIDDFGAGYTVISQLAELRPEIVKIDGNICANIEKNVDNQALATSLLSMAKHFDILVVAEWVETAETANFCKEVGFHALQGYYFSSPRLQQFK